MSTLGSLKRKYGMSSFKSKPVKQLALAGMRQRNKVATVRGAIRGRGAPELKYVDVAKASYAADTTGTVTPINLLATGDDNTSRDGRQVCFKSVQVRGFLDRADNSISTTKCRVMLVWDNAANGSLATIAQILSASDANSFPLVDNANRFTILVDRSFTIGAVQDTATQAFTVSPGCFDVEIYKKLDCITQYTTTSANISSVQNGAMLLVTIGSSAANAGGLFSLATRMRFVDY